MGNGKLERVALLRQVRRVAEEAPAFAGVPARPGVYVFFDQAGEVLYVGKSKCLRERLKSYFGAGTGERRKKSALRNFAVSFAVEETVSHFAALLREIELVRSLAPRLNRQYRYPERYAYLTVDFRQPFPRLAVANQVQAGPRYFGPVVAPRRLAVALAEVADVFALRTCEDPLPGPEEGKKCWRFQVKSCLAPCSGTVTPGAYGRQLLRALSLLTANRQRFSQWQRSQLAAAGTEDPQRNLRRSRRVASVDRARRMLLLSRYQGDDAILVEPRASGDGAEVWAIRHGEVAARAAMTTANFDEQFARLWRVYETAESLPALVEKAELDRRWAIYRFLRSREGKKASVLVRGRERDEVGDDVHRLVCAVAAQQPLLPGTSRAPWSHAKR